MKYIITLILLSICFSCRNDGARKGGADKPIINLDTLMDMNRNLMRKDKERIKEYIENQDKVMSETGTGLFYEKVTDVEGENAKSGDRLFFVYSVSNLSGEKLYSSKEDGIREFVVNKSDIESGWNEAAKLMSKGDSVVAILPPHLAFRNVGDGNKIGPGQILIYNLRLDSIY